MHPSLNYITVTTFSLATSFSCCNQSINILSGTAARPNIFYGEAYRVKLVERFARR